MHAHYTRTESDGLRYTTVRLTGRPIARELEKKNSTVFPESIKIRSGHGSSPSEATRLSLSRFDRAEVRSRDTQKKKMAELFTKGVKCWQSYPFGYGGTRLVSLCIGSTERKSDH